MQLSTQAKGYGASIKDAKAIRGGGSLLSSRQARFLQERDRCHPCAVTSPAPFPDGMLKWPWRIKQQRGGQPQFIVVDRLEEGLIIYGTKVHEKT